MHNCLYESGFGSESWYIYLTINPNVKLFNNTNMQVLTFYSSTLLLRAYFWQQNFKEILLKFYICQDLDPEQEPDPDIFENWIRIQ
jgi:hypothetical protein